MDEHAETVLPIYGETFDLAGFEDLGRGPQGCCGGHWTADPLLVKVPLVLAHGMPQVGLILIGVQSSSSARRGLTQRSMKKGMRGIRTPSTQ